MPHFSLLLPFLSFLHLSFHASLLSSPSPPVHPGLLHPPSVGLQLSVFVEALEALEALMSVQGKKNGTLGEAERGAVLSPPHARTQTHTQAHRHTHGSCMEVRLFNGTLNPLTYTHGSSGTQRNHQKQQYTQIHGRHISRPPPFVIGTPLTLISEAVYLADVCVLIRAVTSLAAVVR